MSAAPQTRIFGMNFGVDPKFIVGGLVVIALLVLFFNSRSDNSASPTATAVDTRSIPAVAYPGASRARPGQRRNRDAGVDRGALRIRAVDATRGDVDPTLRLDMLERLQTVAAAPPGRSLFELGPAPVAPSMAAVAQLNTQIQPKPLPAVDASETAAAAGPQVNIPLKFYGYARPAVQGERNRGLFMNGDNVVVASEGELIDHRYLVVELTPANAKMEDTQIKLPQTLPVIPEANEQ
jgi:hypothetical protein